MRYIKTKQERLLKKRKELRLIIKALNQNPNDSRMKQKFCTLEKHYRSLCRKLKRKHE